LSAVPERALVSALPEPDRASEAVIARCRGEVEGPGKAMVRRLLLPWVRRRLRLAELGEGFQWGRGLVVGAGSRIGRYAYLGPGFACHGPVVVGDLCMIAAGCRVVGADHLIDRAGTPTRLGWPDEARSATVFGADAWIGERVTIREGVTIGAGAVVGSAATVVRDVAPYTIVAGTPARVVRERFAADEQAWHDAAVRGLSQEQAA
jgi:acetyltransferase-like isoleucine patch superfamily enzyme